MTRTLTQQRGTAATSRACPRPRWLSLPAGLLLLLVLGSAQPASAQDPWALIDPHPMDPPAVDDFSSGSAGALPSGWSVRSWSGSSSSWRLSTVAPSCSSGTWGQHVGETSAVAGHDSLLVLDDSLSADVRWSNIRMEFDFVADGRSRVGVLIRGRGGDTPGTTVSDGYLFLIENIPTEYDATVLYHRSRWRLFRRESGATEEISRAPVSLDPSTPGLETVFQGCYRMRVDFFCGNYRLQVRPLSGPTCDGGWCTLVEWTDPSDPQLAQGFVALYHGGTDAATAATARFDNVEVLTWGDDCAQACDPWTTGYSFHARRSIPMKFLYNGALLDYSYGASTGRNPPKIDVATEPPPIAAGGRLNPGTGYCNGWQLLVDLPNPVGGSTNLDRIRAFLEPSHTAVQYVDDGSGGFSWVDDFDQDPESDAYNPVPIVADGATPIANALYDAYQWFVDKQTSGLWATDPLARCRSWYVFLITDGEESCATNDPDVDPVLDQVCQPGEAAELFATVDNPAESDPGIPVFTVGFSEGVSADSPLECIAAASDRNVFKLAANAEALQDELTAIIDLLETRSRSFVPFKVSPPPSSSGAGTRQLDYLTLFPFFTPRNNGAVWDGNLYAFRLNEANPTLPATDDCQIDFSQVLWNASTSLQVQLADEGYSRQVYLGDRPSGTWLRRELRAVTDPANTTLRSDFNARLDLEGTVQPATTQEIVNFLRMERETSLTSDVGPARPSGTPVLGDMYHSQPVILGPPNNPAFYYDYGFASGGASSYRLFANKHAQRRRVALVGANDGLLHAVDAGYYDRDHQGQSLTPPEDLYTDQHDLGNGKELFTFLPRGVLNRLFRLTYGTSSDDHQYMVDGKIAVSDFLDHDGTTTVWRTAAIGTLRRGGRSLFALDVTQPDPVTGFDASDANSIGQVPSWTAGTTDLPGCLDGATADCDGEYPTLLWEFTDTADADGNGHPDLGWTWSKPAIARLAVHNASQVGQPSSRFVAFFGGGHDETRADDDPPGLEPPDGVIDDHTGLYVYAVDVATGQLIHKQWIGRMVPGSFRALDSDLDGFHDRVYFASEGSIWRIALPGPLDSSADGTVSSSAFTRIFDFRQDPTLPDRGFLDEQLFFMEPITVPALFDGVDYTWGLAIGSGDRANLGDESPDPTDPHIDHFFFVLDAGQTTADRRGVDDLDAFSFTSLPNLNSAPDSQPEVPASCSTSSLDPANGKFGWYLALRADEKVTYEATVIDGFINFSTFEPGRLNDDGTAFTATDPPDVCGGGSGGSDSGGGLGVDLGETDPDAVCAAAGIGRVYKLWYECAIAGESGYQEVNDIITGQEAYTIGGNTYVSFTGSTTGPGPTLEYPGSQGYTITNWRQN